MVSGGDLVFQAATPIMDPLDNREWIHQTIAMRSKLKLSRNFNQWTQDFRHAISGAPQTRRVHELVNIS